jgi:hypothetical protein
LQLPEQRPASDVDRCCIGKRFRRLLLDALEPPSVVSQEVLYVLISFRSVTPFTGQCQVADPVAAPLGPGVDVLDLQGNVLLVAIGALPTPLFKEISTYTKVFVKFSVLRATICRGQGEQPSQFLLHGYLLSLGLRSWQLEHSVA